MGRALKREREILGMAGKDGVRSKATSRMSKLK